MHINGNAHENARIAKSAFVGKKIQVKLWRCAQGQKFYVRTLAKEYKGCFTHYYRGNSHYCRGPDCPTSMHAILPEWKGYTPILVYDEHVKLWMPACFEITSCLDLDFRGLFAQGQEWLIYRDAPIGGKVQPVSGLLRNAELATRLPPAFDVQNVLRNLYRVPQVELVHDNPKPARTYVETFMDDAPGDLAEQMHRQEIEETNHSADQRSFQERANERAKSRGKIPS